MSTTGFGYGFSNGTSLMSPPPRFVNLVQNSGAPGGTDWINPTNGLAEFWSTYGSPTTTYEVLNNDPDFNGNFQKMVNGGGNPYSGVGYLGILVIGKSYRIKLKWKQSTTKGIRIGTGNGDWQVQTGELANTLIETDITFTVISTANFIISGRNLLLDQWFEIDEVIVNEL